jgi:hypothetical protein
LPKVVAVRFSHKRGKTHRYFSSLRPSLAEYGYSFRYHYA